MHSELGFMARNPMGERINEFESFAIVESWMSWRVSARIQVTRARQTFVNCTRKLPVLLRVCTSVCTNVYFANCIWYVRFVLEFLCIVMIRWHGRMTQACGATGQVSDIFSASTHPVLWGVIGEPVMPLARQASSMVKECAHSCFVRISLRTSMTTWFNTALQLAARTPRKSRWKWVSDNTNDWNFLGVQVVACVKLLCNLNLNLLWFNLGLLIFASCCTAVLNQGSWGA
jgi:hypothetical protein